MIQTAVKTVTRGAAIKAAAIVAALCLVAGAAVGWWLTSGWYEPRLEAEQLRSATLGSALESQNKAVEDMGKATAKLQADLKQAQADAKARSSVRQQSANRLMSTQGPADPGQQCLAAEALIRQEIFK